MKRYLLMLIALLVLLAGCARSPAPETETTLPPTQDAGITTSPVPDAGITTVRNVDELLAAIAPGAVIRMAPGTYQLNEAASYGKPADSRFYRWSDALDGYTLEICGVDNMTIQGSGAESTRIVTDPRTADVAFLRDCSQIILADFTAGHIEKPFTCSGDVIRMMNCENMELSGLGLFGCGVIGLTMDSCRNVSLRDSSIYDCSNLGILAAQSRKLTVENCSFYDLGSEDFPAGAVFDLYDSYDAAITGCTVASCNATNLLSAINVSDVSLSGNRISDCVFQYPYMLSGAQITSQGDIYENLRMHRWYGTQEMLQDPDGHNITAEYLEEGFPPVKEDHERTWEDIKAVEVTGRQETIHVSTVEEFLNALGPDREIVLDSELLLLTDAPEYGNNWTDYYYWEAEFDGPSLVIRNVSNLTIRGDGDDRTAHTISAVPRYANVLTFENCDGVLLDGFTAGHTVEPGYCAGGVLMFRDSRNLLVNHCGLYGCGILGVNAFECEGIQVLNSDIYECSYGGIQMMETSDIRIGGNLYWDLGGDTYAFSRCARVFIDDTEVSPSFCGN